MVTYRTSIRHSIKKSVNSYDAISFIAKYQSANTLAKSRYCEKNLASNELWEGKKRHVKLYATYRHLIVGMQVCGYYYYIVHTHTTHSAYDCYIKKNASLILGTAISSKFFEMLHKILEYFLQNFEKIPRADVTNDYCFFFLFSFFTDNKVQLPQPTEGIYENNRYRLRYYWSLDLGCENETYSPGVKSFCNTTHKKKKKGGK